MYLFLYDWKTIYHQYMKFQIGSFVNHGKKKHVFVYYTCMNACIKIHFVTKKLQNTRLVLLTHVLLD